MATVATIGKTAVNDFVTKLKSRMAVLKIKPTELAEIAEVGYPYLYRVLKRQQTPSFDWAEKVGGHVGLRIRIEEVQKTRRKIS